MNNICKSNDIADIIKIKTVEDYTSSNSSVVDKFHEQKMNTIKEASSTKSSQIITNILNIFM